jgi:glycosyltransferase involved in cell wall biosynthesis
MKILILNWRDITHPLTGGAETSLFEHAKYWKSQGAQVVWFSARAGDNSSREEIEGIKFFRAGSHYTVHFLGIIYYLLGKFGKPDIVIDCFHGIPFFTPFFISHKKILAVIHEVAGKVWFLNSSKPIAVIGYLIEPIIFWLYRNIQFMTVSESTRKDLEALHIPKKYISVIHNGTDVVSQNKTQKQKKPTLIYLGKITKDKGIQDAIQAFSIIIGQYPEAVLWIVGKEEREGTLREITRRYSYMEKSIQYKGFISDKEKLNLLARAWLLLHPSQKEGWGLTVIEAARQKTPTVGYNVEGLRDSIMQGKTGILTDKNPESLAQEVIKIIMDTRLRNMLSQQAYEWSKNFSWEKSTKESWNLIRKIVKTTRIKNYVPL